MENKEILYDDIAIENAHSLLVNANNKLIQANENYKSNKLTGNSLVVEIEAFNNDVIDAFNRANQILAGIDEKEIALNNTQMDSQEAFNDTRAVTNITMGEASHEVQENSDMFEMTEEGINEYEDGLKSNMDNCEEVIAICEEDIKQKDEMLNNFLLGPEGEEGEDYPLVHCYSDVLYATPEEYASYMESRYPIDPTKCLDENGEFSEEIYQAKKAERDRDIAEYTAKFDELFLEKCGISYAKFRADLNSSAEILGRAMGLRYSLNQQLNMVPYYRIMISEEYKTFDAKYDSWNWTSYSDTKNPPVWLMILRNNGYGDFFYEEDGEVKSYITTDEAKMLFFLTIKHNEDTELRGTYVNLLEDERNRKLGERKAQELYKTCLDENGKIDLNAFNAIAFAGNGFGDGMYLFCEGIENVFQENRVRSVTEYKQSYLLQYLSETESWDSNTLSVLYQNGSTVGNMMIPILTSTVTSIIAGPAAAKVAGTLLMGVSAGGNAKHQALVEGYSLESAWLYGICSGLSEATLGYFLGKIPGISEMAGFTLTNLFSEGFEEFSQEYVDAGLRAVIFGEEIDLDEVSDDAVKSFAMGVLVAGEFNGANTMMTFAFKYKGNHGEISIREVNEYCTKHSGVSPGDAILEILDAEKAKIDDYRETIIDGYDLEGMNQGVFGMLFGEEKVMVSPELKAILLECVKAHSSEYIEFLMKTYKFSHENSQKILEEISTKLSTQDYSYFKTSGFDIICDFASQYLEQKLSSYNLANMDDVDLVRNSLIKYFEQKGMRKEDVIETFSKYEERIGGICTYAAFSNTICEQLTEEQFQKHFGFEKYIKFADKKIYNPLLLADMVFEVNKGGNTLKPNFFNDNGTWRLKDGKLETNSFSSNVISFNTYVANKYLASKGLKITELAHQANSDTIFGSLISGIPDGDVSLSPEYLKFVIETALNENYSVGLNIVGGNLKDIKTGRVINFDGGGHAVTAIGLCDEGIIVNTYGKEYILPYSDIKVKTGINGIEFSTLGYSVLKIEEIGK